MIFVYLYLFFLWIDPQGWMPGVEGLRVDLILYPIWFLSCYVGSKFSNTTSTQQSKIFLFWVSWVAISILINDQYEHSFKYLFDYYKWFFMFFLVVSSHSSVKDLNKTILFLVFLSLVLSVEGIQHKHSADGLGWAGQTFGWVDKSVTDAGGTGRTRWTGIFDGPGVFALVYTMAFPFLLAYLHKPNKFLVRLVALVSAGVMSIAIYYTGSRGGLLTVLAIVGVHIYQKLNLKFTTVMIIPAVIIGILAFAPAHMTSMDDKNRSAQNRVEMWTYGVDMVRYNPVFGVGRGNYGKYTFRLIAHNSAVEVMGETGAVGLAAWIALLYISFKTLIRFYRQSDNAKEKALAAALGNSIIGYLVSASFVTLEYETFYLLIAFTAVFGKFLKEPMTLDKKDFRNIMFITVGFMVGLKAFILAYQAVYD